MMENVQYDKGVFVLSLDTELAWGTRGRSSLLADYEKTREVIDSLLQLCERYSIQATWAVVGHLFLESCKRNDGGVHSEIHCPNISVSEDWFSVDPGTSRKEHSLWYGKDIVEKILQCSVPQEIGSHSFSHPFVDDPNMTEAWYESEILACQSLAKTQGVNLSSYVFPRNVVGYLSLLKKHGFSCFRGVDETWYQKFSGKWKQLAHVLDNYFLCAPPVVFPKKESGLVNIPGSYFFPHKKSWAKFLPVSFRVIRCKKGIEKAIKQKKIFHLWFHPFNLASDPEALLSGLEEVFRLVAKKREEGVLENMTLQQVATHFNKTL